MTNECATNRSAGQIGRLTPKPRNSKEQEISARGSSRARHYHGRKSIAVRPLTSPRHGYIKRRVAAAASVAVPQSAETLYPDGSLRSTRVCRARRQEGQEAQAWLSSRVSQTALQRTAGPRALPSSHQLKTSKSLTCKRFLLPSLTNPLTFTLRLEHL